MKAPFDAPFNKHTSHFQVCEHVQRWRNTSPYLRCYAVPVRLHNMLCEPAIACYPTGMLAGPTTAQKVSPPHILPCVKSWRILLSVVKPLHEKENGSIASAMDVVHHNEWSSISCALRWREPCVLGSYSCPAAPSAGKINTQYLDPRASVHRGVLCGLDQLQQ